MQKKFHLYFRLVLSFMIFGSSFFNNAFALTSFDNDLHYGMVDNSEVEELQNLLVAQKLYSGPINGNYYSQTRKAVKRLQEKLNVQHATGYFGLKTRTIVNERVLNTTSMVNKMLPTTSSSGTASEADTLSESDSSSSLLPATDSASTTTKLSQSIDDLSARVGTMESDIGSLSSSIETINNQITILQALMANLSNQTAVSFTPSVITATSSTLIKSTSSVITPHKN